MDLDAAISVYKSLIVLERMSKDVAFDEITLRRVEGAEDEKYVVEVRSTPGTLSAMEDLVQHVLRPGLNDNRRTVDGTVEVRADDDGATLWFVITDRNDG